MVTGIYKITSPSGRIYIGQTRDFDKRLINYKYINSITKQKRLYESFKKYGAKNHKIEFIEECLFEKLNIVERKWQDYYDVTSKKGLNCVLQETDVLPRIYSDETKKKMNLNRGKGMLGKKLSEEHKLKISLANIGRKHSEESKKKISDFHKGKKLSESHRLNIKNKFEGKKVIDTFTNIIYPSVRKASEELNIYYNTLLRNINGKSKRNKTTLKYLEL